MIGAHLCQPVHCNEKEYQVLRQTYIKLCLCDEVMYQVLKNNHSG